MNPKKHPFIFTPAVLLIPFLFIFSIWLVYWSEVRFGFRLNDYGVYPRTLKGLRGVIFSPFIHGSMRHLWNNTIPLFLLSAAIIYFYRSQRWTIFLVGLLGSGIITWLIGREANHIGASGFIYVLMSFIFFKGIITGYYRFVAVSLIIMFLYGGMLWYLFPIDNHISWEGHLGGFITGFLLAVFLPVVYTKEKFEWEKEEFIPDDDPFMRHFDEDGNFIENLPEETFEETKTEATVRIKYIYVDSSKNTEEE
ncbi:membrane associated rhomboid family serine protease [Kordia periserrulae]|uniref:Membrane associated rhomboid family serine protease n=1 Tax=Kordia periserrulae TaxID=701523 RepID=A0A2T6BYB4_9FLAO|nr:rhomboid family intramembrane serine protease [Kordia periserrulae]PTX60957.1 membrane associated rhomboid family serine protease [Kordia periserrulae]